MRRVGEQDDLHILLPQRFFVLGQARMGDRHLYAQRTRFIPKSLLGVFEKTAWPAAPASAPTPKADPGPRIDVAARLKTMWS